MTALPKERHTPCLFYVGAGRFHAVCVCLYMFCVDPYILIEPGDKQQNRYLFDCDTIKSACRGEGVYVIDRYTYQVQVQIFVVRILYNPLFGYALDVLLSFDWSMRKSFKLRTSKTIVFAGTNIPPRPNSCRCRYVFVQIKHRKHASYT